jgi:hypothetical protein
MSKMERSIEELYGDDPERADATCSDESRM